MFNGKEGKLMTTIEKLRALKESHKGECGIPTEFNPKIEMEECNLETKKLKQEKVDLKDPEKLPNSQYKYYLVWKKHHALKHRVIRFSNGVKCSTCDIIYID